jgi:hypothetical protein
MLCQILLGPPGAAVGPRCMIVAARASRSDLWRRPPNTRRRRLRSESFTVQHSACAEEVLDRVAVEVVGPARARVRAAAASRTREPARSASGPTSIRAQCQLPGGRIELPRPSRASGF